MRLFGDNAYLNSVYMVTPYSAVSGGSKDAYNFYHLQLRINIECAFGMFTHRWAILRSAIPMRVSLKKAIALVIALAKLHNFCIDENEAQALPSRTLDELRNEMQGEAPLKQQHQTLVVLEQSFHVNSLMEVGTVMTLTGNPVAAEYANTSPKQMH